MGKKNKNKKKNENSITFQLVSRSQHDPLINYEDAPQSVLIEDDYKRKKEQQKYGIFYDDDYDYIQHLKDVEEVEEEYYFEEFKPKNSKTRRVQFKDEIDDINKNEILLPSSVFPSQYQESVGMLNKSVLPSALGSNWDPDIVEALDDKLDLNDKNNILDDDFITQAMGVKIPKYDEASQIEYSEHKKNKKKLFDESETRTYVSCGSQSYFTNYSLTSSVIKRNEKLTDLDEHFENFFLKDLAEEDEDELLQNDDQNEVENINLKNIIIENFKKNDASNFQVDLPKKKILELAKKQEEDEKNNYEEQEEVDIRFATGKNDVEDRWDCESIITTYSNLYNRPKFIFEKKSNKIILDKKKNIPQNTIYSDLFNNKFNDNKSMKSATSLISQLSTRNKNESIEEKKTRKKNLKEYKKDRRLEKKSNKIAFRKEDLMQKFHNSVNKNLAAMNL